MAVGVIAVPLAAEAQQPGKVYRIGFLGNQNPTLGAPSLDAFRQGLRELGWVEGRNVSIEHRWADGNLDRLPALASDLVRVTYQKLGREFHDKLAEQQPHMNRDLRGNYPRVARGEYSAYVPYTVPDVLDLKGLPVKAIVPTEGCPYVRFDGAIYKNAPHPNAARLLVDFFLGDEVQLIYGNLGFVTVIGGLEAKIAPEARAFTQVKLLGTTDFKLQEEMLKTAKQIYK